MIRIITGNRTTELSKPQQCALISKALLKMFWGSCEVNTRRNTASIEARKFRHFQRVINATINDEAGGLILERKNQLQSIALGWDPRKGEEFYCIDGADIIEQAPNLKNKAPTHSSTNELAYYQLWVTHDDFASQEIPLIASAIALLDTINSFSESKDQTYFELRKQKSDLLDWAASEFPIKMIELSEREHIEKASQVTAYSGRVPFYETRHRYEDMTKIGRYIVIGASSRFTLDSLKLAKNAIGTQTLA